MRSVIGLTILLSVPALADPVSISGVPAYTWTYGCAPTAGAMVLGYWDTHGYDNLFSTEGPTTTADVTAEIAELATDMGTVGGITYWSQALTGMRRFAIEAGYGMDYGSSGYSWDLLVREVDAGRPLVFAVDTTRDGTVDHAVTAIGYDVRESVQWFEFQDTWVEPPRWQPFLAAGSGIAWGIGLEAWFQPISTTTLPPTPAVVEPTAIAILASNLIGVGIGLLSLRRLSRGWRRCLSEHLQL